MRTITRGLLVLNLVLMLFIVLWLLVGGSNRGYFAGGAAAEVDGILLMLLAAFNVLFLTFLYFSLPHERSQAEQAAQAALTPPLPPGTQQSTMPGEETLRAFLRAWCGWALLINGGLILFVGLWLLVNSNRWGYYQANSTSVDMILLLILTLLNLAFMGLAQYRLRWPL